MRVESLRQEKGTVLLLALMIMSGVVISAVGVSSLILSSLQQTRVLDNAAIAYYAAESGLEDALYYGRRSDAAPPSVAGATSLSNGSSWTRTVATKEKALYVGMLRRDSFIELALYDPDPARVADPTGIERVQIDWADDCGDCSVLQSTLVGWQSGGNIAWDPNAAVQQFTRSAAGASINAVTGRLYRLRLAARQADITDIRITAYDNDAGGTQVDIPGRIKIDSIGTFSNTRQTLTATMPRRTPLSGAFDFVLFSECSLVKNAVASCP